MKSTRREMMVALGLAGLGTALHAMPKAKVKAASIGSTKSIETCPFRLSVISDEITQDFEKACEIASGDFGLQWIELREMWNKNIVQLTPKEIRDAQMILAKHDLRVTDIASPLFKTDWPGAPRSDQSERRDQFNAEGDAKAQDEILERCVSLAQSFKTDRIRCFDYWRLADQKPYRSAINAKLRLAAQRCAKANLILLLENEMSCNTATGAEAAAVLSAIPDKNLMLNWDPGNAAAIGSTPYPNGYDLLPRARIGHCHCKDVIRKPDHKYDWAPVGGGIVDWVGQFRALRRDGYHYAVSLETHWRGAGTPEASTRISMAGLKSALTKAGITC